jgi:hypothetical protein
MTGATAVLQVLRFINLFAAAIVAGGQIYVFMVLIPTKRQFATPVSVQVHNAMLGHQTDRYMKPAGLVSGISALVILVLAWAGYYHLATSSIVFTFIGLAGTLGVAITSRYFNVPTNAMMLTWSLDNIPAEYPQIRGRWDLVHTIRMSCGVLAFTAYLLATLAHGLEVSAGG